MDPPFGPDLGNPEIPRPKEPRQDHFNRKRPGKPGCFAGRLKQDVVTGFYFLSDGAPWGGPFEACGESDGART